MHPQPLTRAPWRTQLRGQASRPAPAPVTAALPVGVVAREVSRTAACDQHREASASTVVCSRGQGGRSGEDHSCVLSRCSVVSDSSATPWTVAHQAPLALGFSGLQYWSASHSLLQGIFPARDRTCISCIGRQADSLLLSHLGNPEDQLPAFTSQLHEHHLQDRPPCLSAPQFHHPRTRGAQSTHFRRVLQSALYLARGRSSLRGLNQV